MKRERLGEYRRLTHGGQVKQVDMDNENQFRQVEVSIAEDRFLQGFVDNGAAV